MPDNSAIYLRVSTDEQTEESQLTPCKEFNISKGWTLVGIFKDHSKSAYHNVRRKDYERLWQLIKDKKIIKPLIRLTSLILFVVVFYLKLYND